MYPGCRWSARADSFLQFLFRRPIRFTRESRPFEILISNFSALKQEPEKTFLHAVLRSCSYAQRFIIIDKRSNPLFSYDQQVFSQPSSCLRGNICSMLPLRVLKSKTTTVRIIAVPFSMLSRKIVVLEMDLSHTHKRGSGPRGSHFYIPLRSTPGGAKRQ